MRSAVLVVVAGVLALAAPAQANHTQVLGVVALVGSLQSELGCPGDWQPECVQTRLQPVAGSPGVFRGTFDVPAGAFEYKVALNNSWDENYGAGGSPGGANIPLAAPGGPLSFTYDHATHVIRDSTPVVLGREKAAHWLRRALFAWDAPEAATYRLHTASEGGLEVQDGAIAGGESYVLTPVDTAVPAEFPHLAAFDTFELSEAGRRAARTLLTGQLIVAAYDAAGELIDATGVQVAGVLDDLYADAARARLGPTWHGRTPRLAVWAPTAKQVELVLGERRLAMDRGRDGVWRIK
jgi:Pullulanase N2 domain